MTYERTTVTVYARAATPREDRYDGADPETLGYGQVEVVRQTLVERVTDNHRNVLGETRTVEVLCTLTTHQEAGHLARTLVTATADSLDARDRRSRP